jgi:hypothetical protein
MARYWHGGEDTSDGSVSDPNQQPFGSVFTLLDCSRSSRSVPLTSAAAVLISAQVPAPPD